MARSMVTSAIKIAARMGMELTEGEPVEALGNCLIESVKGNIEDRDIFDEKIEESINELREKVVKEGERVIGASPYRIEDYSDEDWAQGWDQLRISGVWDVEYFGDLMIIALAHVIGKNILLINTDQGSPPVTVVLGDRFGKPLDSEHPVILAYSGTHYESLIPVLDKDEMRSRKIIQKYIKGEDLFSDEEAEEVIMARGIKIQKEEPFIGHWCGSDKIQKNNLQNSDKSSSEDDDLIENPDSGLDNWRDYHPASTKSELFNNNITWKSNPQQCLKTLSIPINILE